MSLIDSLKLASNASKFISELLKGKVLNFSGKIGEVEFDVRLRLVEDIFYEKSALSPNNPSWFTGSTGSAG